MKLGLSLQDQLEICTEQITTLKAELAAEQVVLERYSDYITADRSRMNSMQQELRHYRRENAALEQEVLLLQQSIVTSH
ncbi:MAG: hypothetical protein C4288_09750 [Leptolyngbya sp. ERB_1_1]